MRGRNSKRRKNIFLLYRPRHSVRFHECVRVAYTEQQRRGKKTYTNNSVCNFLYRLRLAWTVERREREKNTTAAGNNKIFFSADRKKKQINRLKTTCRRNCERVPDTVCERVRPRQCLRFGYAIAGGNRLSKQYHNASLLISAAVHDITTLTFRTVGTAAALVVGPAAVALLIAQSGCLLLLFFSLLLPTRKKLLSSAENIIITTRVCYEIIYLFESLVPDTAKRTSVEHR